MKKADVAAVITFVGALSPVHAQSRIALAGASVRAGHGGGEAILYGNTTVAMFEPVPCVADRLGGKHAISVREPANITHGAINFSHELHP